MLLIDAKSYLEAVLEHKRCIPFTKYEGSTGRTGQAKEFGLTKGRWPEKSVRIVLALLKNAASNAEAKRLNLDNVYVSNVQVNQAQKGRRRTYRAHGRINGKEILFIYSIFVSINSYFLINSL
jgi:large subunit ribosomal protein L17e